MGKLKVDQLEVESANSLEIISPLKMTGGTFVSNSATVSSVTVESTDRAMLVGPVSITGTITIEDGGNLAIL